MEDRGWRGLLVVVARMQNLSLLFFVFTLADLATIAAPNTAFLQGVQWAQIFSILLAPAARNAVGGAILARNRIRW